MLAFVTVTVTTPVPPARTNDGGASASWIGLPTLAAITWKVAGLLMTCTPLVTFSV